MPSIVGCSKCAFFSHILYLLQSQYFSKVVGSISWEKTNGIPFFPKALGYKRSDGVGIASNSKNAVRTLASLDLSISGVASDSLILRK